MADTTDDDILRLYSTVPEAKSYPAPKPLSKEDQDLLRLYTTEPPAPAQTAKKEGGKLLDNSASDGTLASVAKNVGTSVIRGLGDIPGFVGNAHNFAGYLYDRAESAITGKPMEDVQARHAALDAQRKQAQTPIGSFADYISPGRMMPSGQDVSNPLLKAAGEYVPQTPGERMVAAGVQGAVGSFAPGVRGGPTPAGAVPAGALSVVGQGVTEATGDPLLGVAATMAPAAAAKVASAAGNRLIGAVSPERAQLAIKARDQYGIPVNAGQISESPFTRFLEDVTRKMPFSGAGKQAGEQATAFNRAVSNTFGEDAPKVTPEVMARARDRIGAQFDAVANQTRVLPDQPLVQDLVGVVRNTQLGPQGTEQRIRANIQEIGNRIQRNNGEIPYQDLTRVGDPSSGRGAGIVQKLINDPDPHVREAGRGIRDALNDALMRQAAPEQVQALKEARGQWRNLRTVENLVAKSPDGDLSPALLQGRVNANNKGTYGRAYGGGGQLGELADIGQAFLKTPPSSGTSERLYAQNLLANIPAMAAAAVTGDWRALGAPAVIDAGRIATGRLAGSIVRSPTVTNALLARSMGQQQGPGLPNRLLNSALPYFAQAGAGRPVLGP